MARVFSTVSIAAALALAAMAVAASEPVIEEIIVYGEFRQTDVDRLPGSVSVLDPRDEGTVANHLEEILGRAPNVNFASGASRGRYIQIRGVGERGQFIEPLNSSVGLIVDGVDLSGIGTVATLFDVSHVEIFRGPQGTLYGANALAGLVNVVTPDPTEAFTTNVSVDMGDYDARGAGVVLSGPLSARSGYRISAHQYVDDGFMENDFLGEDDTNHHDERTLRAKFSWQADNADWRLSVGRVDIDNGYDAFSLENDRHTRSDEPGMDTQDTRYAAVSVAADIAPRASLEANVAFVDSDIDYGYDEDWTFVGFFPGEYSATDLYARDVATLTADARLVSRPGQGLFEDTLDWVLGVYTLQQDVQLQRSYTYLADGFESDFSIGRLALYGEIARNLGDDLRLTVGARLERHQSRYDDSSGVSYRPDNDLWGGRVLLERALAADALLYLGVTRGYKTGGFNADGSLDEDRREYGDETLWNVEVGYKARFFDDALTLRSALFRMQRRDIQIATSIARLRDNGSTEFVEITDNAAEGHNQGLELEAAWQASDQLELIASVGLLDTEFSKYRSAAESSLQGRRQAHAPDYQFHVGGKYRFGDGWFVHLSAEGKGGFFFSDSHDQKSRAYELLHAAVGYEADRWGVRVWARNLTDEDYFVRGYYFGNDPRDFYAPHLWTQLGAPRQLGVSVRANF